MASIEKIEAAAAAWFATRDSGQWHEDDQAAFEAWLGASVAHRIAFIRMEAAWKQADRLKALGAGIQTGSVPAIGEWGGSTQFRAHSFTLRPHHALRAWTRGIAAALAVTLVSAAAWYGWGSRTADYHTAVGGIETVPLADGSTITLNTDSKIRVALNQTARTIKLDRGEAFFEVAKDPDRPFVVDVGDKRVIAVGTKFSVRRNGDEVRVAVTEGHVRVEDDDARGEPAAHLQPGDIANANHDSLLVQQKPLARLEAEDLGWRNGYVTFQDTALGDIIKEFNRYNITKIKIVDADVAALRIGGSFRVTNVDAFLRLVQEGVSVRAIREGDQIMLTRE